jgi:hypothetical protein
VKYPVQVKEVVEFLDIVGGFPISFRGFCFSLKRFPDFLSSSCQVENSVIAPGG